MQILCVEDDEALGKLIKCQLEGLPHMKVDVAVAGTLEQGLGFLKSVFVDVVILDLGLPDSKGLDTLSAVLESNPNVPVVVSSATDDRDVVVKALKMGAQDYFIKGDLKLYQIAVRLEQAIIRKEEEDFEKKEMKKRELAKIEKIKALAESLRL